MAGRGDFINTLFSLIKEGKATLDEKNKTITFKEKNWEESKDRIMNSSPQGALFLFGSPESENHLRGVYNELSRRIN